MGSVLGELPTVLWAAAGPGIPPFKLFFFSALILVPLKVLFGLSVLHNLTPDHGFCVGRIADSALSCGWPGNPLQFLWIWAILIASSIINYWWHSSNPPRPLTMNVCRVIINEFVHLLFLDKNHRYHHGRVGKEAVKCLVRLDPGRNVQMRRKERIQGAPWSEFILTMLAEDLFGSNLSADGWLSQQPLASLQCIVGAEKWEEADRSLEKSHNDWCNQNDRD